MNDLRSWFAAFIVLPLLAACANTQSAVETGVAETQQISALETAAAQAAGPTAAPDTATPEPTTAPTETSTPAETAPNPLPAAYTGILMNNGECFDFDSGQMAAAPDAACDVWLAEPALFRQMNGMKLSGYVTLEPPARTYCINNKYEPGDVALQTDFYMCFFSNEGRVGFVVVRNYLGGIPFTGIVFDYWVFE